MQDAKSDKTGTRQDRAREPDAAPDATGRPAGSTPEEPTPGADSAPVNATAAPASDSERLRNLALFVPRLLQLIGRLVVDPEVPLLEKVLLGAAAAYVVSPLDILPDAVPLLGQLDDIYLIAICLLRLLHRSGEAKLRQHWEGPEDIVHLLHTVTDLATRYLPGGLRTRLRSWVEATPATHD